MPAGSKGVHTPMNTLTRALVTASCLLVGTLAYPEEGTAKGSSEESAAIALAWLKLVDDGDFAASWQQSAQRFKSSVTEAQWVAAMQKVREPLGHSSARDLLEAKFSADAPRMPKGEYWVVRFKTAFEGAVAHEIVTLIADPDGQWRPVGFFIRPPS